MGKLIIPKATSWKNAKKFCDIFFGPNKGEQQPKANFSMGQIMLRRDWSKVVVVT
jgi:hypothetical protein